MLNAYNSNINLHFQIQVTQDDKHNRTGVFVTNQPGLVPPLVTTNFVVQDQGNSSPRFMRSTMYSVPISQVQKIEFLNSLMIIILF